MIATIMIGKRAMVTFAWLRAPVFYQTVLHRASLATSHRAPRFMAPELARCSGCGSTLQTQDSRAPGYIPLAKRLPPAPSSSAAAAPAPATAAAVAAITLRKGAMVAAAPAKATTHDKLVVTKQQAAAGTGSSTRTPVCQRCYRIKHYGEVTPMGIEPNTFTKLLQKHLLERPSSVVALVVDLLDYPNSVLTDIVDTIGTQHSVLVIGNKVDLLPDDASRTRIAMWLKRSIKQLLPHTRTHVHLCSGRTGEGVNELVTQINEWRGDRDVFVIGCTNVGKSQLINTLIRKMELKARAETTTSPLPGTTINFVRFSLGGGAYLFDTPGIMYPHHLAPQLRPEELKLVVPHRPLRPITFELTEGQSLLLGGLARLDLLLSRKTRVLATVFVSPRLHQHVCKTERVAALYERHRGHFLCPPIIPESDASDPSSPPSPARLPMATKPTGVHVRGLFEPHRGLREMADHEARSMQDVVFPGIGWVALTPSPNTSATLHAFTIEGLSITTREPLLPYEVQKRSRREYWGARRFQPLATS